MDVKVALVVHNGAWCSQVFVTPEILQSVNLRQTELQFIWEKVAPSAEVIVTFSGEKIACDRSMDDDKFYDWILLPHFWGDFDRLLAENPQVVPWLVKQYQQGAAISCTSSGIFWAAEGGLLDGRRATTYWRHAREFEQRYPQVNWLESQSLVEDGGLYSCNGQSASMDLTMHMVEKWCGAEMITGLARDITFDVRRNYDLTLFNIAGLRRHNDNGIHKAQDWLDSHYREKVEFEGLADMVGMSKSTFIRRFQKACGERPSRYLQRLRVEAAKHQLINTGESIKTISLNVGYRDFGYFSEVFKSVTELTPREFRKRHLPTYQR